MGWSRRLIVAALVLTGAACDEPRPTPQRPRSRAGAPAATVVPAAVESDTPLPSDRPLPSGPSAHGLVIPSGGELVASNDLGDDYVVPFEVAEVVSHVRSQLAEIHFEPNGTGGGRFRRVTPRGAPPELKLYVLVMPFPGRGTLVRVQRLPAEELTPETLDRNVERFAREQRHLD